MEAVEGPSSMLRELPGVTKVIGAVVAPVTFVTALLVYFGWSRTTAMFGWFGIDPTSLGFSNTDYLLVSQDGLFVPGVVMAMLALAVLWLAPAVRRSGRFGPETRRRLAPAVAVVGLLLAAAGLLAVLGVRLLPDRVGVAPACLVVGVTLLSYAAHAVRPRRPSYSRTSGIAEVTGLTVVVALAAFWAAGDYSSAVGRERAAQLAAGLDRSARVVVYSEKSLGIPAEHGVQVVRCAGGGQSAYAFRYSGLVLLLNTDGQYVFLPVGWTRTDGSAVAVPRGEGIRLDYRSPGSSDALPTTC
ncbi:hypothetical protein [Intrasporangium sp. YIM S08009]|uniref:hypothetical protein n=1 Tax=Intrasporangium zincisolvens TaxID=3080018 RepID=UPI002B0536F6|nr:hypothetical protein [Intrasporangium sp. YIM S08009]